MLEKSKNHCFSKKYNVSRVVRNVWVVCDINMTALLLVNNVLLIETINKTKHK